jgi:hypothetical protein
MLLSSESAVEGFLALLGNYRPVSSASAEMDNQGPFVGISDCACQARSAWNGQWRSGGGDAVSCRAAEKKRMVELESEH